MLQLSPISQSWIRTLCRPFFGAMFALIVVASVILSAQIILRAPFVPSLSGVMLIWLGMLPESIGTLAPAAVLIAVVLGGQNWRDGGELQAMLSSGCPGRVLIAPTAACGLLVAVGVTVCTQWLAPMGRTMARTVVVQAASEARLRPGPMVQVGDVWMRVGDRRDGILTDIVVAGESWVAWAPTAEQSKDGTLQLNRGRARGLGEEWSMSFDRARLSLGDPKVGSNNFERSHRDMLERIERMEFKGKNTYRERLTLYKRTTLALAVPILALLGIPIGFSIRRPALITGSVILSVWAVQRLGDHGASTLGPEVMALVPIVYVTILLGITWSKWRVR